TWRPIGRPAVVKPEGSRARAAEDRKWSCVADTHDARVGAPLRPLLPKRAFFHKLEDARRVSTPQARGLLLVMLEREPPKSIPRTRCRPRSINPGANEGDRVPIHHTAKFLAAVHHHEVRCDHTVENPRCGAIRIDRVSSGIVLSPIRTQWCPV